jgi:hypothetical protein
MPKLTEIVPTSRNAPITWRYTLEKPTGEWTAAGFDDSTWKQAPGPFGTAGTPGITPKTVWSSDDIWLRREFSMPEISGELKCIVYHDEDVEVYVNGVLASSEGGFVTGYGPLDITADALKVLKPGTKITLAVHCHQTTGGQGIDVGFGTLGKG